MKRKTACQFITILRIAPSLIPGASAAGGESFAELFTENLGGGVTSSVLLGGAPLGLNMDPEVWTPIEFTATAGNAGTDVTGGLTLSLIAVCAPNPGCFSDVHFDNVSVSIEGPVDTDGDGVSNCTDNCTLIANADQRDANSDGYGNVCDPDLDNDNFVNFNELNIMQTVFFTSNPDANFDGVGVVNFIDLGIMESFFFDAPGPSGLVP